MTLMRWRPYGDFFNLRDQINRLFDQDFFKDSESDSMEKSSWTPLTDIFETENEYVFKLEVPGMTKDDIQIEITHDTLIIKGERKEEKKVEKENYHRIERCCGSFSRSFHLPQNVNSKSIDAVMKDGILELRVPKKEEAKPQPIQIKVK